MSAFTTTSPKTITGYWFASSDTLPYGDERKVIIGETLSVEGPLEICVKGLHASREPFDALQYASGSLIYKVESSGNIIEQHDKYCSRHRKAIAVIDGTELLRRFARQQALSVIHLWDAPKVVREYLETGEEDLREAARLSSRQFGHKAVAFATTRPSSRANAFDAARASATATTSAYARYAAYAAADATATAVLHAVAAKANTDPTGPGAIMANGRDEFNLLVRNAFEEIS